jgi:Reverse transcriptase (RNA-dependent DNA polymerase)
MGSRCRKRLPLGKYQGEGLHHWWTRVWTGYTLIIFKALFSLRSSGLCWYQRFSGVERALGFNSSKAETEIWMREKDSIYEYIAVYVDDLLIAAKDPEAITKALMEHHKLKLNDVGTLTYHLGCDYFRDNDGTLCYGPSKYISKLIGQFEDMFGSKPKEYTLPLEKGDHPEG